MSTEAINKLFSIELNQDQLSTLKVVFENSKQLQRLQKLVRENKDWELYFMHVIKSMSFDDSDLVIEELYRTIFLQIASQNPFLIDKA